MIRIKITTKYLAAFSLLTLLCGLSHEMVHHLTATALCGCWGYKTFNSFYFCNECDAGKWIYLATIAGPLFTFGLMWMGFHQLKQSHVAKKHLGFALIFANFPVNRMLYVLLGSNDEQWAAQNLFGASNLVYIITIILVYLCTLPVLITAFKSILNKKRTVWFIGFFLLPFIFILMVGGIFLEEYLLKHLKVWSGTFLGIPYLLLMTELICLVGYYFMKKHLYVGQYEEIA